MKIDALNNTVIRGNSAVPLSRSLMETFVRLNDARPNPIAMSALRVDAESDNAIRQHIVRLREKLKTIGVNVLAVHGGGYLLQIENHTGERTET